MRAARALIVIGVVACLAFQAPPAGAQAAFLSKCGKFILKYVGEPLTAGMAERGGELIVDYFAQKFQGQPQELPAAPEQQAELELALPSQPPPQPEIVITPEDLEALSLEGQARGMSECQVRQQIEAALGVQPFDGPIPYAAEAYCAATGVLGFVEGMSTPGEAIDGAVYDCINRGGIPACCAKGAHLVE